MHKKLKVEIITDILEKSNTRNYLVGETLNVQVIRKESDYYEIIYEGDIDMIAKDCVKVINSKKTKKKL